MPRLLVPLVALLLAAPAAVLGQERSPNIIVILTDDQGTLDAGVYGATDLHTPNMDRLAARGVRFSQFYAAAPVCSPSRAGLLTGRYPLRAGLPSNAGPPPLPGADPPSGLPGEEITMAEAFRAAGYATAHIGKWHLGHSPDERPRAQGFDYSFGHLGGCIDNYGHFFYWNGPNRHDLWRNGVEVFHDGRYFPDLMVEEAEQFMIAHRDGPFLVYFALNTPHYPYQGEERWLEHYADLPYPRNLYAAFLTSTDTRVGRLLDAVEALGLEDDTIVIFQSDHGHSVEERAHGGGGWAGPYRGAKFSLFEGGIRVPAIISWPGVIPQGVVRDQLAVGIDWLPTVAALAEVNLGGLDLDGRSLQDVLLGDAPTPHEMVIWHVGRGERAQWAVREGDWKLIGHPQDPTAEQPLADSLFLVNLSEDVSERINVAARHPAVVERLRERYEAWLLRRP